MLARLAAAAIRGICVAFLVALPSLLLPTSVAQSSETVVLMALVLGGLIVVEYTSKSPSLLEFRDAPPLNRNRFVFVAICIIWLSVIARHSVEPTGATALLTKLAILLGDGLDFVFSPVYLLIWALPETASPGLRESILGAAGLAYSLSVLSVVVFAVMIRGWKWPLTNGPFNVWINMPLFDPTTGGDVVARLQRDGRLHIGAGVLLPFILPALAHTSPKMMQTAVLDNPQLMVWCVTCWAMMPAGLIIRGMARLRVAELIEQKRRSIGQEHHLQIA